MVWLVVIFNTIYSPTRSTSSAVTAREEEAATKSKRVHGDVPAAEKTQFDAGRQHNSIDETAAMYNREFLDAFGKGEAHGKLSSGLYDLFHVWRANMEMREPFRKVS